MSKKTHVLVIFSALAVFAQEEQEIPVQEEQVEYEQQEYIPSQEQVYSEQPQEQASKSVPANTITLDIGPTIIGVGVGMVGDALLDGADASGFGFGLQYERQIFERLSVAARFAYLGFGAGFVEKDGSTGVDVNARLDADLSSFSIESHVRTYPFGGSFFLDGLLGYANMSANFKGEVWVDPDNPLSQFCSDGSIVSTKGCKESANIDASRGYLKYGIKLGWRVDFGEPGGFIFEHGFGYYFGSAFGKTIVKQFSDKIRDEYDGDADIGEFDDASKILEDFIFIGGPRYTFAFGWRF